MKEDNTAGMMSSSMLQKEMWTSCHKKPRKQVREEKLEFCKLWDSLMTTSTCQQKNKCKGATLARFQNTAKQNRSLLSLAWPALKPEKTHAQLFGFKFLAQWSSSMECTMTGHSFRRTWNSERLCPKNKHHAPCCLKIDLHWNQTLFVGNYMPLIEVTSKMTVGRLSIQDLWTNCLFPRTQQSKQDLNKETRTCKKPRVTDDGFGGFFVVGGVEQSKLRMLSWHWKGPKRRPQHGLFWDFSSPLLVFMHAQPHGRGDQRHGCLLWGLLCCWWSRTKQT